MLITNENLINIYIFWFRNDKVFKKLKTKINSISMIELWQKVWFVKGENQKHIDLEMRTKFSSFFENDNDEINKYIPITLDEYMSIIVLYDQISRNIFRGTDKAYSYDKKAYLLAENVMSSFDINSMPIEYLLVLFLTCIHQESLEVHEIAENILKKIKNHKNCDKLLFNSVKDIFINHNERIKIFGRYPERNKVLGKQSTNKEIVYMSSVNYIIR